MSESIADVRFRELRAAGYTGSLSDMEVARLRVKLGLSGAPNYSISDLYNMASEEPWPFVGFSPVGGGGSSISDNFNRANSTTSLGNTNTGQTWVQGGGGVFGITSNKAYSSTVSSTGYAAVDTNVDPLTAATYVEASIVLSRPTNFVGRYPVLFVCSSDGQHVNGFRLYPSGEDGVVVLQDGTATAYPEPATLTDNCTMKLRAYKPSGGNMLLEGSVNGVVVTSHSFPQKGGEFVGFGTGFTSDGDIRFDDFAFNTA